MNVEFSFQVSYIILLTTATITFIESIRTNIPMLRHIFNLETCISIVAGYFYSLFLDKLKKFKEENKKIDWKEMTQIRYLDWMITTPMMLIVLCGTLAYNSKTHISAFPITLILLLNYVMLGFGYLGEINAIDKTTSWSISFLAFFGIFGTIYSYFIHPKQRSMNSILYALYFIVWSMYGMVYFLEEETKNIGLNMLDVVSKCLIGIGIWVYFTKIIVY
jgi:bacteriorhodopsin